MKHPWDDDYEAYCQEVWARAAEHWREGTRRLETQERLRIAWEARERELQEAQEQRQKENARAKAEARRTEQERQKAELLKENARVREARRLEQEREAAERREREAWAQQIREQQELEEKRNQERRERRRAAAIEGHRRSRARRAEEEAERQDDLNNYDDDERSRFQIHGVTLEHLDEVTASWEAAHRLNDAESGYYQAGYWMHTESHRESALVRMAESHCERLAGKRMYARPFSQMTLIPCGLEPKSKRLQRLARKFAEF